MSTNLVERVRKARQLQGIAPMAQTPSITAAARSAANVPGGWFGGILGVVDYWNRAPGDGIGGSGGSGWQQGTIGNVTGLPADDTAHDITSLVLPFDGVWLVLLRAWVWCGPGAYAYKYGVNHAAGQPLGADNFNLVLSQPIITQHESDVVTIVDTAALGRSYWAVLSMNAPAGATYNAAMGIYAIWTASGL